MKRSSGILMHISSLPGKYGIGTFGKEAYEFVDFLKIPLFTILSLLSILIFTLLDEIIKMLNTSLKYFYLIITLFSDILVDFRENLSYNGIS